MPAKYTQGSLQKNQRLVAEWTNAREEALREPKDLRRSMATLQNISWRTSAIESSGTLSEWISHRERQLLDEMLASGGSELPVGFHLETLKNFCLTRPNSHGRSKRSRIKCLLQTAC